jgi:hypothetical protein
MWGNTWSGRKHRVYWKPVYNVLGDSINLILVNARHMKNVPGRKTDKVDSEWIMLGSDSRSEMHTGIGRIDIVIVLPKCIYLFEFIPFRIIICSFKCADFRLGRWFRKPLLSFYVLISFNKYFYRH